MSIWNDLSCTIAIRIITINISKTRSLRFDLNFDFVFAQLLCARCTSHTEQIVSYRRIILFNSIILIIFSVIFYLAFFVVVDAAEYQMCNP